MNVRVCACVRACARTNTLIGNNHTAALEGKVTLHSLFLIVATVPL
jgi:hypothetical protein